MTVLLFQTFSDVYGVRIGYPLVNSFNTICQSPPYTYAKVPIGAVQDIFGTLRHSRGGSVIGTWSQQFNCYVHENSSNTCSLYSFSHRVSECDNDSRMQINIVAPGFSLLKRLNEVRSASLVFRSELERIEQLVSQLGAINLVPQLNAFKSQIAAEVQACRLDLTYYMKLIYEFLSLDVSNVVDRIEETGLASAHAIADLKSLNSKLTTMFEENQDRWGVKSEGQLQNLQSEVFNLTDQVIDIFHRIRNDSNSISIPMIDYLMKHISYSSNLISAYSIQHLLDQYSDLMDVCEIGRCDVNVETQVPLSEYSSKLQLLIDSISIDFPEHNCIVDLISNVASILDGYSDIRPAKETLAFKWHDCRSRSELAHFRRLFLDFSRIDAQQSAIWSAEGISGSVFQPERLFPKYEKVNDELSMVMNVANVISESLQEKYVEFEEKGTLGDPDYSSKTAKSKIDIDKSGFFCTAGRYGKKCVVCPKGTWSPGGYLHICSNAPEGADYYGKGWMNATCPFKCNNDQYKSGTTCKLPPIGYYPINGTEAINKCLTSFSPDFVRFVSPGKTRKPYSCNVAIKHVMKLDFNMTHLLSKSFTIDLWMKLDKNSLNRALLDAGEQQIGFSIIEIEDIWTWYLRFNGSTTATIEIWNNKLPTPIRSKPLILDQMWHHYSLIYDANLRILSFTQDSSVVGTAWYSFSAQAEPGAVFIGGMFRNNEVNPELPTKFRLFPGSLALLQVHETVFPLESLESSISVMSRYCGDSEWNIRKCAPVCASGAVVDSADSCLCHWGKYLDQETHECEWCDSTSTMGSNYPHLQKSDCICMESYIWDSKSESCLPGKPALMLPNVTFVYNQIPASQSGALTTATGYAYPIGTTMTISLPSNWNYVKRRRRLEMGLTDDDVTTQVTITLGFKTLVATEIPLNTLPFQYTFNKTGEFKVETSFSKPGHLPGTKYSAIITIKMRAADPFFYPAELTLDSAVFLKAGSSEPSENQVMYAIGKSSFSIYDKRNPPIIIPPATVRLYTLSTKENLLPSNEIVVQYVWDKSSAGYKKYINDQRTVPVSKNTTDVAPSGVMAAEWCVKNVPNCIMAIVLPVVGCALIAIAVTILGIIIRVILKKRKRMLKKQKAKLLKKQQRVANQQARSAQPDQSTRQPRKPRQQKPKRPPRTQTGKSTTNR